MKHSNETNTAMKHSNETPQWNTAMKHSNETQPWNTDSFLKVIFCYGKANTDVILI